MQEKIDELQEHTINSGLKISASKTVEMRTYTSNTTHITLNEQPLIRPSMPDRGTLEYIKVRINKFSLFF